MAGILESPVSRMRQWHSGEGDGNVERLLIKLATDSDEFFTPPKSIGIRCIRRIDLAIIEELATDQKTAMHES